MRTGVRGSGRGRSDAAYASLRESIVTLRLAPGTPLTEAGLCRRLSVSRTPARAALVRLEQEGLVVASGGRWPGRVGVAPLTTDDMRELFLIVGALDGAAARLAAALEPHRRAALADEAAAVNDRLRRLSETAELADIRTAQELDLQFHRCYESAAGPRLQAKLGALHARRERYVRVYTEALIHTHSVQESLDEHGAIIAAIAKGDAAAAERHAAFNYRNALERYWRIVAIHGERGNWG